MKLKELEESLLIAAADDWVHFAELIFCVEEDAPHEEPATLWERAILVTEDFERKGWWRAGDVTAAGFAPWNVAPEEASRRMRNALLLLQHPVFAGDVCWFEISGGGIAALKGHQETEQH